MVKLRFALAGSLLLSGMLLAAVTQAEESFSASGTTCRDITWKPEVLAKYPNVAAACQGVVQQGGESTPSSSAPLFRIHRRACA